VLHRPQLPRGRRAPRPASRHREDAHARRPDPAARLPRGGRLTALREGPGRDATAPHGFVLGDAKRETALLLSIIEAVPAGPGGGPVAAAVAQLITEATATDVCFVHVLDDAERSLTLAGATPPFDKVVGQVSLAMGSGVTGWVASRREPAVISENKE